MNNPYPFEKSDSVRLSDDGNSVIIIDQSRLPNSLTELSLSEPKELYEAIKRLKVRGAPAIGIFAGFAMYVLAKGIRDDDNFYIRFRQLAEYLNSSRPTAVNLTHALERMIKVADGERDLSRVIPLLEAEAYAIRAEDIEMCRAMSEHGLTLIKDGDGILTHCNAGPLATSRYGTGLGTLFLGRECGLRLHAYCDETRPLLQGARLTAYELHNAGIDVTLICDSMEATVMKQGKVNAVFTGCDRVAVNGDAANKIGTCQAAIVAKRYGIPFYVFCPSSTIDLSCKSGADIVIEERSPDEITTMFFSEKIAPDGIKCFNPAFDVTDAELITAIVTEKGIFRPPFDFSQINNTTED